MDMNAIPEAEVKKFDLSVTEPAAEVVASRVDVDGKEMIADLSSATVAYCSMQITDNADRVKAYNAMSNADEQLSEHIGEEIPVRHIYVECIKCENEKTHAMETVPRIVLIASDGRTYQACSFGVFSSLKRIFQIFGRPDEWDFALVVRCKRVKTRGGYYTNTLEAVGVVND